MHWLPSETDARYPVSVKVLDGPNLQSVDKDQGAFDIDAKQWTRPLGKDGALPIHAVFPPNGRYAARDKDSKPFPNKPGPVIVAGVLQGVTRRDDDEVDRLQVAIDSVHFPTTSRLPVTAAKGLCVCLQNVIYMLIHLPGVSGDPSPKRKRSTWTYDDAGGSRSEEASAPAPKRHMRNTRNAGKTVSEGSAASGSEPAAKDN
jgi:hypothetical protein